MKLNGSSLLQEIKHASSVTGAELVHLRATPGSLHISASNDGRAFSTVVEVEAKEKWACAIKPADGIAKTLKGVVTLEVDEKSITVKTSTYKGTFQHEPYMAADFAKFDKAIKLDAAQSELLMTAVDKTNVGSILSEVNFEFRSSKNGFRAAAWDRVHFALLDAKKPGPDMHARMVATDLHQMLSAVPTDEKGLHFATDGGFMFASNSTSKYVAPAVQVAEEQGLKELMAVRKGFMKPLCSLVGKELREAIDRATSACETGQSVQIQISKGKVYVRVESKRGKFVEVVSAEGAKKSADLHVDPATILDLLALAPDEVQLGVEGSFLWLATQSEDVVCYFACLTAQA